MHKKSYSFLVCLILLSKLSIAQNSNDVLKSTYEYDANGNIKSLQRYDKDGNLIDDLKYHYQNTENGYKTNTNRLTSVTDLVNDNGTVYKNDIKNQLPNNYKFDELGNIISDKQEEIEKIDWSW